MAMTLDIIDENLELHHPQIKIKKNDIPFMNHSLPKLVGPQKVVGPFSPFVCALTRPLMKNMCTSFNLEDKKEVVKNLFKSCTF